MSVKVTLRGKKYDVQGATSVEDVQKSVEEQAGLAKEQQVTQQSEACRRDAVIASTLPCVRYRRLHKMYHTHTLN